MIPYIRRLPPNVRTAVPAKRAHMQFKKNANTHILQFPIGILKLDSFEACRRDQFRYNIFNKPSKHMRDCHTHIYI